MWRQSLVSDFFCRRCRNWRIDPDRSGLGRVLWADSDEAFRVAGIGLVEHLLSLLELRNLVGAARSGRIVANGEITQELTASIHRSSKSREWTDLFECQFCFNEFRVERHGIREGVDLYSISPAQLNSLGPISQIGEFVARSSPMRSVRAYDCHLLQLVQKSPLPTVPGQRAPALAQGARTGTAAHSLCPCGFHSAAGTGTARVTEQAAHLQPALSLQR